MNSEAELTCLTAFKKGKTLVSLLHYQLQTWSRHVSSSCLMLQHLQAKSYVSVVMNQKMRPFDHNPKMNLGILLLRYSEDIQLRTGNETRLRIKETVWKNARRYRMWKSKWQNKKKLKYRNQSYCSLKNVRKYRICSTNFQVSKKVWSNERGIWKKKLFPNLFIYYQQRKKQLKLANITWHFFYFNNPQS